ncbi:MAG: arginine repressor [Firmicutes bacterium]|nr:arginine repressor [Bacillota bacterium]
MKNKRQNLILQIIRENKISTHEQLVAELKARGVSVTQATVSRDMQALGIVKTPSSDGYVYTVRDDKSGGAAVYDTVLSAESAMHTVVIKTRPGMASGVAAIADARFAGDMLGSIAGDDTVFVITRNEQTAKRLADKIKELFKISED